MSVGIYVSRLMEFSDEEIASAFDLPESLAQLLDSLWEKIGLYRGNEVAWSLGKDGRSFVTELFCSMHGIDADQFEEIEELIKCLKIKEAEADKEEERAYVDQKNSAGDQA